VYACERCGNRFILEHGQLLSAPPKYYITSDVNNPPAPGSKYYIQAANISAMQVGDHSSNVFNFGVPQPSQPPADIQPAPYTTTERGFVFSASWAGNLFVRRRHEVVLNDKIFSIEGDGKVFFNNYEEHRVSFVDGAEFWLDSVGNPHFKTSEGTLF